MIKDLINIIQITVVVWAGQFRVRKHFIGLLSKKVLFLFKEKKKLLHRSNWLVVTKQFEWCHSKYLSNEGIFIPFQTFTFSSLTYS